MPPGEDVPVQAIPSNENAHSSKRRRYCRRTATITIEDLRLDLGLSSSDSLASNMTGTSAIYKSYKEKLMGPSGTIVWRLHSDKHEQVILNDIHPTTGSFLPTSYVQVTHIKGDGDYFQCTCRIYAYICSVAQNTTHLAEEEDLALSDSLTCLHCRFYKEHLLSVSNEWNINTGIPSESTWLYQKLQESGLVVNNGVVQVGPVDPKGTTCFSVRSKEEDGLLCTFVHLTCGCFVSCQAGACIAASHHRKKAAKLISLSAEHASLLCGHLQMLYANQECWGHLIHQDQPDLLQPDNTEDRDIYNLTNQVNVDDLFISYLTNRMKNVSCICFCSFTSFIIISRFLS